MRDGVQKSPQFPISHIIWSILWEHKGPTAGIVISDGGSWWGIDEAKAGPVPCGRCKLAV